MLALQTVCQELLFVHHFSPAVAPLVPATLLRMGSADFWDAPAVGDRLFRRLCKTVFRWLVPAATFRMGVITCRHMEPT